MQTLPLKEPTAFVPDDRLDADDRSMIEALNVALDRLSGLRAVEINVADHLARSKITWKLTAYQQVLLHRAVALVDGTAIAWNGRATLAAMLSARAAMETMAIVFEFEKRMTDAFTRKSLSDLDALAMQGLYATRDAEWLKEIPTSKATNVLTYIDAFNKRVSGFRECYDLLSEICHPNAAGHNFMFSKLDRTDSSIRFYDERDAEHNRGLIISALAGLPLVEPAMVRMDKLIAEISRWHHSVAPVKGRSS